MYCYGMGIHEAGDDLGFLAKGSAYVGSSVYEGKILLQRDILLAVFVFSFFFHANLQEVHLRSSEYWLCQ